MADSSLDDFFAKKDKSKKKSKSKMTPADVLAKGEEGPLKKEKKKKEKEMPGGLGLNTAEDTAKKEKEDAEWADYEEQKQVDYTGLRIQTLQMKEGEDRDATESGEEGEGGEGEEGGDKESGPWKGSGAPPTSAVAAAPAPPPEPEEKKEAGPPKKYVPPSVRAAALNPSGANPISRRPNKKAPNIQSELDFPTLGGGPSPSSGSAWGAKRYEDSGAGDIESNPGLRRGGNLSLENKFAALQD